MLRPNIHINHKIRTSSTKLRFVRKFIVCATRRITFPEFSLSLNDAAYSQRQRRNSLCRLALTVMLVVLSFVKSSVYLICDLLANLVDKVKSK